MMPADRSEKSARESISKNERYENVFTANFLPGRASKESLGGIPSI